MEVIIDIKGIQNAETYVNRQLSDKVDFKYYGLVKAEKVNDGNAISLSFAPKRFRGETTRIIAKQFSKKNYTSVDIGIANFSENLKCLPESAYFNWKEVLRIEQEKYWLVIFEED